MERGRPLSERLTENEKGGTAEVKAACAEKLGVSATEDMTLQRQFDGAITYRGPK